MRLFAAIAVLWSSVVLGATETLSIAGSDYDCSSIILPTSNSPLNVGSSPLLAGVDAGNNQNFAFLAFTDTLNAGNTVTSAVLTLKFTANETLAGTRGFNFWTIDEDSLPCDFSDDVCFNSEWGDDFWEFVTLTAHTELTDIDASLNDTFPTNVFTGASAGTHTIDITAMYNAWRARPGWTVNSIFGIYISPDATPTRLYTIKSQETGADGPKITVTYTQATPTIQATNVIIVPGVTTANLFWDRGNGENCVVFVKQASSGTSSPVDGTTYTANTAFGSGTQIGATGWYCVYNGTGTSVSLTALSAGTAYIAHVCEYNGSAAASKYLTTSDTNNPFTALTFSAEPTVQCELTFDSATSNTIDFSISRGNGAAVIVAARKSGPADFDPNDGTTYTDNLAYGSGSTFHSWNIVYIGTGTGPHTITNVEPNTTYVIAGSEFNGSGGTENYLTCSSIEACSVVGATGTAAPPSGLFTGRPMVKPAYEVSKGGSPRQ